MARSLAVIVALMALVWFMVPRVTTVARPPVDVAKTAAEIARTTGRTVVAATGLPQGWKATSARYFESTGGLMTWHAGYQAPSGNYVAVEQTVGATPEWVGAKVGGGERTGQLRVGPVTWAKFERRGTKQNSLLNWQTGATATTTVLTGSADLQELTVVAKRLTPIAPSPPI